MSEGGRVELPVHTRSQRCLLPQIIILHATHCRLLCITAAKPNTVVDHVQQNGHNASSPS